MYNSEKKRKNLKKKKKDLSIQKSLRKKSLRKKEKKRLSLKYNTTVTPLTAIKAYGVRGEATIQFTQFRSF